MKNTKLNLNPAGPAFEDLTIEEMVASQGSGDVKPQTTVPCGFAAASSAECAGAAEATVAATISFFSKKC